MGVHSAEQSVEIDAPPEACFDAAIDYETFPRWQAAVERAEVLERDPEGRGEVVRFEVDAKVKRISYTLRYHYDAPGRIWWEFVEGDGVADVEGDYVIEPLDGGRRTRVAYRLGIDPGVPVPGILARRLNKGVMRRSVTDLRDEVERRAGAHATVSTVVLRRAKAERGKNAGSPHGSAMWATEDAARRRLAAA